MSHSAKVLSALVGCLSMSVSVGLPSATLVNPAHPGDSAVGHLDLAVSRTAITACGLAELTVQLHPVAGEDMRLPLTFLEFCEGAPFLAIEIASGGVTSENGDEPAHYRAFPFGALSGGFVQYTIVRPGEAEPVEVGSFGSVHDIGCGLGVPDDSEGIHVPEGCHLRMTRLLGLDHGSTVEGAWVAPADPEREWAMLFAEAGRTFEVRVVLVDESGVASTRSPAAVVVTKELDAQARELLEPVVAEFLGDVGGLRALVGPEGLFDVSSADVDRITAMDGWCSLPGELREILSIGALASASVPRTPGEMELARAGTWMDGVQALHDARAQLAEATILPTAAPKFTASIDAGLESRMALLAGAARALDR